ASNSPRFAQPPSPQNARAPAFEDLDARRMQMSFDADREIGDSRYSFLVWVPSRALVGGSHDINKEHRHVAPTFLSGTDRSCTFVFRECRDRVSLDLPRW